MAPGAERRGRFVGIVESLAFGGDGVTRDAGGRVVFVPGTAPGDEVEVRLTEERKGYARGEVVRVVVPSPARVAPPCPLFVRPGCGGCQWQHVAIEAQRRAKEAIVRGALRRLAVEVEPVVTPAPEYRWRRRARLRWRGRTAAGGGGGGIGYAARRSHRLVDVDLCPQMEEGLERGLEAVRGAFLDGAGSGEIELLLGGRGDVHVVVAGREVGQGRQRADGLLGAGGVVGVTVRDGASVIGVGAPEIDLADGRQPFLLRADVFAQASAPGNRALRQLVRELVGALDGARVLELHAGSGNFTRDLAAEAARVVAVEEHAIAVELGRRNVELAGAGGRVEWHVQAAESFLSSGGAGGERFDAVVLDPPRTGLGKGAGASLARIGARRIVYVSCDPQTLARDLAEVVATGAYQIDRVVPIDLMPQTYHVEVVAGLRATRT